MGSIAIALITLLCPPELGVGPEVLPPPQVQAQASWTKRRRLWGTRGSKGKLRKGSCRNDERSFLGKRSAATENSGLAEKKKKQKKKKRSSGPGEMEEEEGRQLDGQDWNC